MSQRSLLLGQRILVVDDDIDTLFLLSVTLEEYGAEVTTATSVAEAIELFKELHPTLMISDIGLPFEDGFSLIRELRTLEVKRGWQVPAIALTGYAGKETRERALELGFQQYLTKPIFPDVLIEIIVQLLRLRE
ncbi:MULTISPECIES: response regulator [Trichocoleus]|uniref:Response regulator n=1 Tax=Trichocoleus desertorum GB2-A4 TaxID=2933944 RepID=A0ABV0JGW8_9CYAN|nr:response regulator [Trichocoleus sp. FACHB-46]MBD1863046.1 response regulator [Trichocoleus sp. FACHB-46]